jgi:NAD(P)-dependent dehydrogenase (short-subunit alcohol dehydrogenase family)
MTYVWAAVGSQTIEAGRRGMFIYRSSKAALNMVAKLLDVELAPTHGVLSLVIHPGHVVTDMGGEGAPLSALESVRAMVRCIEQLDAPRDGDSNVRFVWYDGRSLCW